MYGTRWALRLAGLLLGLSALALMLLQEGPVPAQAVPVLVAQGLLLLCSLATWRWRRAGARLAVAAALLLSGAVLGSGLVTAASAPGYGPGAILLGVALLALPQLLLAVALMTVERRASRPGPAGRSVSTPSSGLLAPMPCPPIPSSLSR